MTDLRRIAVITEQQLMERVNIIRKRAAVRAGGAGWRVAEASSRRVPFGRPLRRPERTPFVGLNIAGCPGWPRLWVVRCPAHPNACQRNASTAVIPPMILRSSVCETCITCGQDLALALIDLHYHHARPLAVAAWLHEPTAGRDLLERWTAMVQHVALAARGSGVDGTEGMLVLAVDA
jgi:hypothetical protein